MHKTNLFVDKCAELLAFRAEFIAQSDFNCVTYQKIMFYNILLLVQFFKLKTISKLKLLKICEQIYCESPEVYKGLLLSFLIKDGSKEDLYTAQLEINKLMGGFYEKCTSANKLLWLYEQWYKALLNLYSHKDVSTKTEFLSEIATTLSFLKNRLSTEVRNPELLNKLEKTVAEYVTKFLQGSFNITDFEQATETLVENSLLKEHVTAYQNVLKEPNADFLTTDIITSEINTVTEDHIPILSYFVGYFFGVFEHTKLNSELLSFGDKCSMAGILPNIDTSVNSLDIDSDIKDLSELPVLIKTRKAQTTWSGILTDLQLCEKSLDYDQAILVDYFLLLRAAKKQPDLISGTINIETVARFFNSFQSVLTNNYEFSTQNTWLVGALFSSFPTNQDVITEFRIAAWNWYKTAAELQNKGDVINYTGFERQIINLLHDAPSPYHVSIIKCYYDYLIYDDELSFETLKTTLDTLHIVINKDYKATFGAALESVIKTTSVLLKKIKAIYEDNNDYNLQSLISTGTIDANFRKRLLVLLSKLTGNSVSDLSALSYAELNRLYIFSFEEMPEKIREDIIIALKNLRTYIKRSHNVSINKFSTTLCVNNIIKTYTYRLLFFYSEHTEKLIPSTLKNLLALSEEVFFDKFVPQLVFCRNKLDVSKRDYDYYVLVQIYNLIDMCIEMYTSILGRHLDLMENIDNVVKDDLVADYLRSTVLYPLNIILAELLESMKAEDFNRNVICVGDAVGTLLYVKDTKNLTTDVSTKIVVTEDLNPHSILPRCVGLITKNKQPPLSHMSVLANQRKIPWFSPDPKEFDRIKSLALTDTLTNYYLYVSLTSCFLENVIKPAVTKTDQKMIVVPMLPVGVTSTYIVPQNTFDYSTVGSKAYNLSKVREYFPLNSLDSYCITYNAFQEFIKPIFAKYISQGNGPIEDTLQAIRIDIKSVNFGDQFMAEFNNLINGRFANKQVILRSTTNVEDLNDHTGAGIYESVIVEDKKQLVTYLREVYSSFYTLKAWEDRRFEQFNEDLACMAVLIK